MNMRRGLFCLVCLAVLLSLFFLPSAAPAEESYSSGVMRLLRYEGDVTILNSEGVSRFVMEDVRFDSGESMLTGEDGIASVGLDDTKIVTLDHLTHVQFVRESQHLCLNLTEGTLFLDVQQALDENEGFDIQTTTMTAGIRGTVVFLSVLPAPDGSGTVTRFSVLEGTADVSYTDSTGASRRIPVSAGQVLTAGPGDSGAAGIDPVLTGLKPEDVEGFILNVVDSDDSLRQRVTLTSDMPEITADLPAGGDWFYDGVVTLVAQSASKLYDGLPLTRPDNCLVYGLPAGFSISVTASGSRTDAGTSPNEIAGWSIFNANGDDVTSHFPNVRRINGSLVVDRTPLVVWTGSAEKVYDGTPLTNPDAGIRTVEGYSVEQPIWMNTSLVTETAMGSEQMFALSGHTFVLGTNPLTGETETYDLPVGSSLSVLLHGEGDDQSIEFKIEHVKETDLPEDVLRVYAENPAMLARACQDAGWDPDVMAELIAALPPAEGSAPAVASDVGLMLAPETAEKIMADSANVRIHVDTDITNYNTRALTNEEADITPITVDPTIVVTATGSRINVGTSDNTYSIYWGDADPKNYILREELGTLTVTPASLTVTTGSAEHVYDGSPFTCDDVEIEGLAPGDTVTATPTGTITDVGFAENTCDIAWDGANEKNYTVSLNPGRLTVEPLSVSINCGGGTVAYSGGAFVPSPTLTYRNGSHAGETVSAVRVARSRPLMIASASGAPAAMSRTMKYRFTLFTGDTVDVTLSGMGTGVGSYTLSASVSSSSASIDCDGSSVSGTGLVVEPAVLEIATGSASKEYDGEPLTSDEVTVTGLSAGDTVTVTAIGSQTEVGSSINTYSIDWGSADPSNYKIQESLGKLEVTAVTQAVTVTITGHTDTSDYDGEVHSVSGYDAESDNPLYTVSDFTFSGTAEASRTDAGTTEMGLESSQFTNTSANFSNVVFSVTDGYQAISKADITVTITGHSSTCAYDGKEHSVSGYDMEASGTVYTSADFTFSGTDAASGTTPDAYPMGLEAGQFTNTNPNCTVTFNVTDGVLTITRNSSPVTITLRNLEKVYDGKPLDGSGADSDVEGLDDDMFWAYGVGGGTLTNAGSAENPVEYYVIGNRAEEDVSFFFSNITLVSGQLVVNPAPLAVTTPGDEKFYDGNPLPETTDPPTLTGLVTGESATIETSGSQTDVGSSPNTYSIAWGSGTNKDNYYVQSETIGTLTVNPRPVTVTITGHSATKTYNGSAFTIEGYDVSIVDESELYQESYFTFSGTAETSGTMAGTYPMGLLEEQFTNTNSNFSVSFVVIDGVLQIDPLPISVTLYPNIPENPPTITYADQTNVSVGPGTFLGTNQDVPSIKVSTYQFSKTLTTGDTMTLIVADNQMPSNSLYVISGGCNFYNGSEYTNGCYSVNCPSVNYVP